MPPCRSVDPRRSPTVLVKVGNGGFTPPTGPLFSSYVNLGLMLDLAHEMSSGFSYWGAGRPWTKGRSPAARRVVWIYILQADVEIPREKLA
jgi:hypothetical protein